MCVSGRYLCSIVLSALLQLNFTDEPFCAVETPYVKTACLPKQTFPDGMECVVSGRSLTEAINNETSGMHLTPHHQPHRLTAGRLERVHISFNYFACKLFFYFIFCFVF